MTLFGETFEWNILGYDQAHGGFAYFCAYMVAMVIFFFVNKINFPQGEEKKREVKHSFQDRSVDLRLKSCIISM